MKVSQFNNIFYHGKVDNDFFWFCIRKDFKLIRYFFLNIWFWFLTFIFKKLC